MITAIAIPKLTLTMEGGTLVRWHKREGEVVQKDEVLFELETDKANVEVPSPASGQLKKIVIQEGPVVVGAPVGFIGEEQDVLPSTEHVGGASPSELLPSGPSIEAKVDPDPQIIRATPAARRLARESNLNLVDITGTGPEGRITQEDVEAAITSRANTTAHVPDSTKDFRSFIADRTSQAWHTVPHIHVGGELNAAGLKAAIEKARSLGTRTISVTDLLLFVAASALRPFPVLNAVWHDGSAKPHTEINIGFAVHSDRGVVVPVIHGVDRRTLSDISLERLRLREAVASRTLQPRDIEGGTFTLTNLGMFPVDFFAPIVNHPQVAILATGRMRQVASFETGAPVPVWRMWANLALDHRVADGAVAAQFLAELQRLMEDFLVPNPQISIGLG